MDTTDAPTEGAQQAQPAPGLDAAAAAHFLLRWCEDAGFLPHEYLNLWAKLPDGRSTAHSWRVSELDDRAGEIAQWIEARQGERMGVYWTCNPLVRIPEKGKPRKTDLSRIVALAVDLDPAAVDPKRPDPRAKPYPEARASVLVLGQRLAADGECPPALVLDSGNGVGVFYRPPNPAPAAPGQWWAEAEHVCELLTKAAAAGGDAHTDGTHNCERVMRLPFTVNYPSEDKVGRGAPRGGSPAAVLHRGMARLDRAAWAELAAAPKPTSAPAARAKARAAEGEAEEQEASPDEIEALAARLAERWQDVTICGNEAALPDLLRARLKQALLDDRTLAQRWAGDGEGMTRKTRSEFLHAVAGCLKRAGFSPEDAARVAYTCEHTGLADKPAGEAARAFARSYLRTGTGDPRPRTPGLPAGYEMRPAGLYFTPAPKGRDAVTFPVKIAPHFEVLFRTHDEHGAGCGLVIRWRGPKGLVTRTVRDADLYGDFRAVLDPFADLGLAFDPDYARAARAFFYEMRHGPAALTVHRAGWHDGRFVLGDGTVIGEGEQPMMLHPDAARKGDAFHVAGTLAGWQQGIARLAVGNSRFTVSLSLAFVGPLLHVLGEETGGLHLVGGSKIAKSTLLLTTASAWGAAENGQVNQWDLTKVGLELLAAGSSDCVLILDELAQAPPHDTSRIVYMLANGAGRVRGHPAIKLREGLTWRSFFLSSGEITLRRKLEEVKQPCPAGLENRLVNVPAAPEGGHGVFEVLHGFADHTALALHLRRMVREQHGTATRAYLDALTKLLRKDPDGLRAALRDVRDAFVQAHLPAGADAQVATVCRRFGLIAAAGDLARQAGILPWEDGEAQRAAAVCFRAWLVDRGSADAGEDRDGFLAVQTFVAAHGDSRFTNLSDGDDRTIHNRAGWRRLEPYASKDDPAGWRYMFTPAAWAEVTKGQGQRVAAALAKRNPPLLVRGEGSNLARKEPIPEFGHPRLYVVSGAILDAE